MFLKVYFEGCMEGVCVAQLCLFVTPRTVACQAPLFMRLCRQEYWSVLPFPSPGILPDPGIEPWCSALQADSFCLSHQGSMEGELLQE